MSSTPDEGLGEGLDEGLSVGLRSLGLDEASTSSPAGAPGPHHGVPYRTDFGQSHHSSSLHFRLQGPTAGNAAVADPASEGDDVLHLLNSTDGELSGLSHLDAPISDSVYIVCGVLIAMVLVGLIIVLLAVTISKLRKREETNNNSLGHEPTRTLPAHQLPQLQTSDGTKVSFAQSVVGNGVTALEVPSVVTTTTTTAAAAVNASAAAVAATAIAVSAAPTNSTGDEDGVKSGADSVGENDIDDKPVELFLWSYPPRQLSPYSGTKDSLSRELPCETPQDSKGLRKNLRGKWKRLVKKRKPDDSCTIPPELRDQLKQIYVY